MVSVQSVCVESLVIPLFSFKVRSLVLIVPVPSHCLLLLSISVKPREKLRVDLRVFYHERWLFPIVLL